MTDVAYWFLVSALAVSAYAAMTFVLGGSAGASGAGEKRQERPLDRGGAGLGAASLMYLLVTGNFQVQYVYQHVSTYLTTAYTVSAFWAGQERSLLLWLWLLAVFSIFVQRRAWNRELLPYALATLARERSPSSRIAILVRRESAETFLTTKGWPDWTTRPEKPSPTFNPSITVTNCGLNPRWVATVSTPSFERKREILGALGLRVRLRKDGS